jgi:2-iminobutanoate/2-iminopropanoate deaminase
VSKRVSYELVGLEHDNPIPAASRIGPFLVTSAINGKDAGSGQFPSGIDAQCARMFANVRLVLGAAGATPEDVLKVSVWLKDRADRPHVNTYWLEMFPDPHSRPARHTFTAPDLKDPMLVQCEILAVLADRG